MKTARLIDKATNEGEVIEAENDLKLYAEALSMLGYALLDISDKQE